MSKLLTSPRVIKEISQPKKRKKIIKRSSEDEKMKFIIIREGDKRRVNELFRIYKENPFNARVKYMNNDESYSFDRVVIFEKGDNNFEICNFVTKFGISTTNRIYSSQKKESSISYKNGKFYIINNTKNKNTIRPLTHGLFSNFVSLSEGVILKNSKIYQYMLDRFQWVKMLTEHPMSFGVNYNVVKEKKLFSYKDITRHVMKTSNNIGDMVMNSRSFERLKNEGVIATKTWVSLIKYLDGIENLTSEILDSHLFIDTCKMARTLGRKVNCRWGLKRLKEEHDTWAREIGNIVLDCDVEYDLKVKQPYLIFAEWSGFNILKTNKELLIEGMVQNHCVGTYIDKVQRGNCGIYHVEGYTLQLVIESILCDRKEVKTFKINQFRGKHNTPAPQELIDKVQVLINSFKEADKFENMPIDERAFSKGNDVTKDNLMDADFF